jgi:hypothetical protein
MLCLGETKVTDTGLEVLKGMTTLTCLELEQTNITDAGLERLKGLSQLSRLRLEHTKVTDEGVKKLQQALPHCKIDRSDSLSPLTPKANDQFDKTSAAKPADEVSPASGQSATKEGSQTKSKPAPASGVTAEVNAEQAKAIAEIEKMGGKVAIDEGKAAIAVAFLTDQVQVNLRLATGRPSW